MTPNVESEERPAYDILACKTVEMLDIVNFTRQLLLEKYNNDQSMWLDAMFRVLMIKNSSFLVDERNSSLLNLSVTKILKDQLFEMFRISDKQNCYPFVPEKSESSTSDIPDVNSRSHILDVGRTLIATFRVFTNFLLQSRLDLSDELINLQVIMKNIEKYGHKLNSESEKTKFTATKSTTDNVNVQVIGERGRTSSVEVNECKSSTSGKLKRNERLCSICGRAIIVFNNDEEFSLSLHEQEEEHKKAMKKGAAAAKLPSVSQDKDCKEKKNPLSSDEEIKIRSLIIEKIGPNLAKCFRINSADEFYCCTCKCKVVSLANVTGHVEGKLHKKNSGTVNCDTTARPESLVAVNAEADSTEQPTFRATIPIKSLF